MQRAAAACRYVSFLRDSELLRRFRQFQAMALACRYSYSQAPLSSTAMAEHRYLPQLWPSTASFNSYRRLLSPTTAQHKHVAAAKPRAVPQLRIKALQGSLGRRHGSCSGGSSRTRDRSRKAQMQALTRVWFGSIVVDDAVSCCDRVQQLRNGNPSRDTERLDCTRAAANNFTCAARRRAARLKIQKVLLGNSLWGRRTAHFELC